LYSKTKLNPLELDKRLSTLGFSVIKHSEFDACLLEPNGWVRQQYMKLNIHHLLNDSEWLMLDGDTVLRNSHQVRDIQGHPVFRNEPGSHYQLAVDFTDYLLGVVSKPGDSFMTSHWLAERLVLESLDRYILEKHHCNLISVFQDFYNKRKTNQHMFMPPLNEVEIYGQYATKILNHNIVQKPTEIKCCGYTEFLQKWITNPTQDLVLNGRDNFPIEFWASVNIEYQQDLDQALNC
jgi:hypothetical protein